MYYKDIKCDDLDYWELPHEIEAHGLEESYYHDYLTDTQQSVQNTFVGFDRKALRNFKKL